MKTKLNLELVGKNGNAFYLLAYFQRKARKAGWSKEEILEVIEEAQSGDYNHLIQTLIKQ